MKLRNTGKAPVQFMVRTNAGEKTEFIDDHGNKVQRVAKPVLTHIYIPAEAEVELDDKLWLALLKSKTKVQEFETVFEDYPQFEADKKNAYRRPVRTPTGKTMEVNLVKERVKSGALVVTEKPKAALSLKEMVEALAAQKVIVSKDTHSAEDVERLYLMLCE